MTANLFGWSEQAWLTLDQFGILFGDILIFLTYVGFIWGAINHEKIRTWLRRNRFRRVGQVLDTDVGEIEGVIFCVSKKETPRFVIAAAGPAWIGFVYTKESEPAADAIAAENPALTCIKADLPVLPDDPRMAKEACRRLIDRFRSERGEAAKLAVDVTGGKTPMSIGAFMAAEEAAVSTLYLCSEYDARLGRTKKGTERVIFINKY